MADARDERRLPVLTGRARAFADGLAAEEILPARFAALAPAAAGAGCFADLAPDIAGALAGEVLVAGYHTGGGPGGAAAARALAAAGVIAVVAGSFADGFAEAVLAAGLPPLEVDAPSVFRTGHRIRVNLEAGTIANLSSGDRQAIRNLTDHLLETLRLRF